MAYGLWLMFVMLNTNVIELSPSVDLAEEKQLNKR